MTVRAEAKIEVAVHHPPDLAHENFAPRWIEALESLGASVRSCDFRAADVLARVSGVDGAMWHFHHSPRERQSAGLILTALETGLGVRVFPNHATRWHFDEKIAQHYLFESIGAPAVKTWIFWSHEAAARFVESCSYPIVFKLSTGAGGSNVVRIDSRRDARALVLRMFARGVQPNTVGDTTSRPRSLTRLGLRGWLRRGLDAARYFLDGELPPVGNHHIQKHYLYLQEYLPDNPCDIRITVIGNRAFGFRRRNRPGDFRASGSGIIDWDPQPIPAEAVRLAHAISRDRGFQSMAYDFLLDRARELRLSEISYGFASHAVERCPGYWDRDLAWHPGHIWPERAQVEDFVQQVREGRER
ncbi:MAG TPA: hypothetical protein VEC18_07660 [Myxococcota bacterium]|nr:hypothetical protein [Myxococcota bacterium]